MSNVGGRRATAVESLVENLSRGDDANKKEHALNQSVEKCSPDEVQKEDHIVSIYSTEHQSQYRR